MPYDIPSGPAVVAAGRRQEASWAPEQQGQEWLQRILYMYSSSQQVAHGCCVAGSHTRGNISRYAIF